MGGVEEGGKEGLKGRRREGRREGGSNWSEGRN